jgi:hypothetical protein
MARQHCIASTLIRCSEYDDVTLCMMMRHYVCWCDTVYDDVTLCDTMYDDVTLRVMMWHYVWWCDTMKSRCDTMKCDTMMWHYVTLWCDTIKSQCDTMKWHYEWCDTMMWHYDVEKTFEKCVQTYQSRCSVSHYHTQCHIIIHGVTSSYIVSHHHT